MPVLDVPAQDDLRGCLAVPGGDPLDYLVLEDRSLAERMTENFRVFDFALADEDMAVIDGLDRGEDGRIGPNPDKFDWVP